jgi:hypothetical protein
MAASAFAIAQRPVGVEIRILTLAAYAGRDREITEWLALETLKPA